MKTFLSLLTLTFLLTCGSTAAAQSQCAPFGVIEEAAKVKGYAVNAYALSNTGMLLTIWVNDETDEYAAVFTSPDFVTSCIVDEGSGFGETLAEPEGELN